MDSKRHISFQWKVFVPVTVCMWVVIIGTLIWQIQRVHSLRDEMMYEQLSMLGTALVEISEDNDSIGFDNMAHFISKYYSQNEHYDPMNVWVVDMTTDSLVRSYGSTIRPGFKMPKAKQGTLTIPPEHLNPDFDDDGQFIYTMHAAPFSDKKIYVILNYTKGMQEMMEARFTNFWLVFIAIGILATIVAYIITSYFGKSLKQLRTFAQASNDPKFILTDEIELPDNELGDITKQIIESFNQRTNESERRKKEHEIAKHAMEEKERIKRDLTGNINHELKTPIGVIKGLVDTIVKSPDMPEPLRQKFMSDIQKNVTRLTDLIEDITAITKLEVGAKLPSTKEINFRDFVKEFSDYLENNNVLQEKMTFNYDLPEHCIIDANESLLHTVLLNFVKNSVAYSEGSMCRLIFTKEDEDFYHFAYYDNGIGVPPEHLSHLFERFYRVNAGRSRNLGGTGLGLPIVETSIKAYGGYIEVLNHFPSGLEFNFSIKKHKEGRQVNNE